MTTPPPSATSRPTTTVLRVKRPRHVAPPSILSFAGKKRVRDEEHLANLVETSATLGSNSSNKRIVWKRVEQESARVQEKKRSIQLVDAVLEHKHQEESATKRRRLALTLVPGDNDATTKATTTTTKSKGIVILSPKARLVDESLKQVQPGKKSIAAHLDMVEQDSRLDHYAPSNKWISHRLTTDGSTILHACALENDVESTRRICMTSTGVIDVANQDGQRPYQLATELRHSSVAQVLEAFGADTQDYVYDVYSLHPEQESNDNDEEEPAVVELRGGIGYWDMNGKLVLEALSHDEDENDVDDNLKNDDDADSNAEDNAFNDYPEEEDDDQESWDSDDLVDDSYRRVPIVFGPGTHYNFTGTGEDEDDGGYDAQYGIYDATGDQNLYAYDKDYDNDD